MALVLAGRSIDTVEIVDDEPAVREAYLYTVGDAGLSPHEVPGPLRGAGEVAQTLAGTSDAALCDQLLKRRNYANFNGAELAACLYRLSVPALLCTAWEDQMLDEIRPWRRWIPVLMKPEDLNEDTLPHALESCVEELDHGIPSHRRPWRTQVHVVDLEGERGRMYVHVPAWGDDLIRLGIRDVPEAIQNELDGDYRCYARVNLGAESPSDLFFDEWEPSGS